MPSWCLETPSTHWETPWNAGITATIEISSSPKEESYKEHLQLLNSIRPSLETSIAVYYTDGSQKQDTTTTQNAAALCRIGPRNSVIHARSWNLGSGVEVADSELYAAGQALKFIKSCKTHPKTSYIFVDSQAALKKLGGFSELAVQAKNHCKTLNQQGKAVIFQWCPGHSGIYGNEIVDRLAKKGLEKPPIRNPTTTFSHLARRAKAAIQHSWQQKWAQAIYYNHPGYGKFYRAVLAGNEPKLSLKFQPFSGKKPVASAYIQLRTGIGGLRPYLKLVGKATSSICWCCGKAPQTPQHILLRCPLYTKERKVLEKALNRAPLKLQVLFSTPIGRKALEAFLSSTGICTPQWIPITDTSISSI